MGTGSYHEACIDAATAQGLNPITELLTFAGIRHEVEQTGGFCMVVTVTTAHGTFGITADEDEGRFLLVFYPGTAWTDGEGDATGEYDDLTAHEVVATIEGFQP